MSSTIHATAHGLVADTPFQFANVLPLDTGIDEDVTYYVLAAGLTADDFKFALTAGGAAITLLAAIETADILSATDYTLNVDVMAPPVTPPTPNAPTPSSAVVAGVVRLRVEIDTTGLEAKVRLWEVQITSKFTDQQAIPGNLTGVAATDILDLPAHGLVAGDKVRFLALTGGTGLTTTTPDYFVIAAGLTASTFKVSLTAGGAAVNFTTDVSAGSAVKVITPIPDWSTPLTHSLSEGSTDMSIPALGGTVYATRARMVDVFGNVSDWSPVATTTTVAGSDALNAALAALANDVQDGVITETKIAPGSITTPLLAAGAVNAQALAATIILASLIKTADTGRRIEVDLYGIRLYDASDGLLVNIPTNGDPVYVKGAVNADSLVSQTAASFRTAVSLEGDAVMTLQTGVSAPTIPPVLSASVDSLTLTTSPTSVAAAAGIGYDSGAGTFWVACDPTVSPYVVAREYNATTGALVRSIAATGSTSTTTETVGATTHVSDGANGRDGSTDSHVATPIVMPSPAGATNMRVTKVAAWFAGHNGTAQARTAIWDDVSGTGNAIGYSNIFTAANEGATGLGDSHLYNQSLAVIPTVTPGGTYFVGFMHTDAGEGIQWDFDSGASKATYLGDGTLVDGTGWAAYSSSQKPNAYATITYDIDTRLETAPMIGVATDGTYIYTLDTLGQVWKYNRTTLAYVGKSAVLSLTGTKSKNGLFYDATAAKLVITHASGTDGTDQAKFSLVETTFLTISSTLTDAATSFPGATSYLRGGARVNDPLNASAATYWVPIDGTVYAFLASTGANVANRSFGTTATANSGLTHDGTQFRGWAVATPTKVWKFSNWDWTTASAVYWIGYSWYDITGTTHETVLGPRASITMRRRERVQVTNSAIPVGGAETPDRVRIYALPGASDFAAGAGWLQITDALTARYMTDYTGSGTHDGAGTPFASGAPAELKSSTAGWSLKGDGTITTSKGIDGIEPIVRVYTSGTTSWVRPAGLSHIVVECVGGGGAGGGAPATAASESSGGAGGAGGTYSRKTFAASALTGPYDAVVGAGGTGVSGAAGNTGGASSFGTTLVTAPGGGGGAVGAAGTTVGQQTSGSSPGAAGTGDISAPGGAGNGAFRVVAGIYIPGGGGNSALGGGAPKISGTAVGNAGLQYGGGGSGAHNTPSLAAKAGGAGAAGVVIVTEFYGP